MEKASGETGSPNMNVNDRNVFHASPVTGYP
jgi:hypothetical protein